MDAKSAQQLLQWFEEIESESTESNNSDMDIVDNEISEEELENTVSASSSIIATTSLACNSSFTPDSRNSTIGIPVIFGKDNKTMWLRHKKIVPKSKTIRQNIITKLPGVKNIAKKSKTVLDCWKLFFTNETVSYIVECTNQKLEEMKLSYQKENNCSPTDFEEMNAFIGLLYLAGVKKAQHLSTDELWNTDGTAPEFFSATMSKMRFHTLVQAIRFDDRNTRNERAQVDNLAPIRQIFENFVQKCKDNYTIGEYTTIDEMLEAFRGRCRFRQYISNKPAKYGIKIYALTDARIFYVANMEIYAGRQPPGNFQLPNDAGSVVKRLIEPIKNSGRNVTMDNYFMSIPLANDLFLNHRLTVVGTLRKNKREVPPEILNIKNRPLKSSIFLFGDKENQKNNCLLVSYVPKKNKNVLMLSTFHDSDTLDPSSRECYKPDVITFYNVTKGGVDVVDRLKSEYSVTRISNRWPLTIFCSLLNIATVNSQIIFRSNTDQIISRRAYITELAKKLSLPHMIRRASIPTLPRILRQKIENISGVKSIQTQPEAVVRKPRCAHCPVRKNRFTQYRCDNCSKPICKEHTQNTIVTCVECAEINNEYDA